ERLGATFLDREGQQRPCIMGCYGIGVGRVLGAAVEQNHDERGILWPAAIAPFHIYLAALSMDQPEIAEQATSAYQAFTKAGLEVLFDDRVETPGVKFNDADLLGLPVRVTVSPRTLRNDAAEIKGRLEAEGRQVPLEGLVAEVRQIVERLVAQRA
ncbi:MAG: proline--tRNA ligase, partial [Chloroflexi bacterium]|nr:proline--tRNA ligase [Chloroflexota bacterium]